MPTRTTAAAKNVIGLDGFEYWWEEKGLPEVKHELGKVVPVTAEVAHHLKEISRVTWNAAVNRAARRLEGSVEGIRALSCKSPKVEVKEGEDYMALQRDAFGPDEPIRKKPLTAPGMF